MSKKSNLGKALQRQQQRKMNEGAAKVQNQGQFFHDGKVVKEEYQIQQENLQSIIDQNPLNEYLQMAEMANIKYQAEKKSDIVVNEQQKQLVINVNAIRKGQLPNSSVYDYQKNQLLVDLQIPRRPRWDEKTTVEQLRLMENENFLKWRKELAKFEEEHYQIQLTPYEKNIEVWKQLWRVVEKADILVQVVDGRDILFYHCNDLTKYVHEEQNRVYRKNQTKINFLLINKSDLISDKIREEWSAFLNQKKLNHMFFSAKLEQEKIDKEEQIQQDATNIIIQQEETQIQENIEAYINTSRIADRKILLSELKSLVQKIRKERQDNIETTKLLDQDDHDIQHDENTVIIGMVGYPNVGKSSVINALCNRKLVGVAARPGKTKHFQTIPLEKYLLLCDCPGLIFPNASSSRAEMVCNGVLPIDNIKDYLSPMDLLAERIPKIAFEKIYGINLQEFKVIDASTVLSTYSQKRGFMTGRGLPDEAKAAKLMLKDFVNGKLLYVKLPPNYQGEALWQSNPIEDLENLIQQQQQHQHQQNDDANIDNQFENQLIQEKKISNEEILEIFTQENLAQLMEGKKVHGIKLTKEQRREIKHNFQRGDPIDIKKYLNLQQNQKETLYKTYIQGKRGQI
ncbi:unnamed protein product [Paramecium primaurelia]|uniref:G domain-containing protein n=1 Tax=Paramecium primaurelia TaxID=5886 RepID=A0A8S1NU24_PARPR|nr:unnamed protein product [Paramecium primaurelia]